MKQLRKKCIIFGLMFIISIEIVICGGFEPMHKKNSSKTDNLSISGTPLLSDMFNNYSSVSSDNTNQLMQTDDQPLDLSNPNKRPHDTDNNTQNSNAIKRARYMGMNNSSMHIIPKTIIDLTSESASKMPLKETSELTTFTTINPLKVDSNSNLVITSTLYFCAAENQFIIRNYTSYIESFENVLVLNYSGMSKYEAVNQKKYIITKNWKSDNETDIWTMIKSVDMRFLLLKSVFKNMLNTSFFNDYSLTNPLWYDRFLNDLVYYIKSHGQPTIHWNNLATSLHNNKRTEALGDIWINKEVSLYCCCSGINSQMVLEGGEKDIQLKKKLNAILLIPEVYEDFYKMPQNIVDNFVKEIKVEIMNRDKKNKRNNIIGSANDLKIEQLPDLKWIMKYLIHTVQKNEASAEEAYNEIKQIKLHGDNVNLIGDSNAIEVYNFVCNKVGIFYKYHGVAYKLYQKQKGAIRNRTRLIHINNMHEIRAHNKLLGDGSLNAQQLFISIAQIKNINEIENIGSTHVIDIDDIKHTDIFTENNILLSIKDHYHVQFVDNEWHTVTMIHLPYYIHRQKNGTIVNYQFHTIKDIITHLKSAFNIRECGRPRVIKTADNDIFDIKRKNSICRTGRIYPFKYNKMDKTWSLITDDSDLNKTVQTIESENCNVVFYYIKEDIKKAEFCFAQFVYSSEVKNNVKDDNMEKTRIPLFLSKFMVSGAVLGPYDKNSISYHVFKLGEYKDLVPIDYTEIYTPPFFKTNSSSSRIQINDSRSSVIERHMKENDLNYAIKHYYSDFFIRNSTDFYEDPHCYYMNIQSEINNATGDINITWNTRFYESVYEYTTYKFDSKIRDERSHVGAINQPAHASFIDMLQRKNPSLNTALYGHCFYKTHAEVDYKTSAVFCLTMKDLLEKMNAYLMDINTKDEIIDPISGTVLNKKDYDPRFILKDISSAIQDSKLQEIRQSDEGIISIRDNNHNSCKYGIHYDILNNLIKTYPISRELRLQQLENYQKKLKSVSKPKNITLKKHFSYNHSFITYAT
ncbi:hypothetical protein NEPAR06_2338 [Nematocida parisii]|nr:hypothetical protein NEPAR06_2338 [Nematocida parisii]